MVGLGLGMSFVPLQVVAFSGVGKAEAGLAAGLFNTSQEAGGALGVAVAATIAFSRVSELTEWAHGDPVLVLEARAMVFHLAFFVGACFALASLAVAAPVPDESPRGVAEVSVKGVDGLNALRVQDGRAPRSRTTWAKARIMSFSASPRQTRPKSSAGMSGMGRKAMSGRLK